MHALMSPTVDSADLIKSVSSRTIEWITYVKIWMGKVCQLISVLLSSNPKYLIRRIILATLDDHALYILLVSIRYDVRGQITHREAVMKTTVSPILSRADSCNPHITGMGIHKI